MSKTKIELAEINEVLGFDPTKLEWYIGHDIIKDQDGLEELHINCVIECLDETISIPYPAPFEIKYAIDWDNDDPENTHRLEITFVYLWEYPVM